jgi:hypothetical protein
LRRQYDSIVKEQRENRPCNYWGSRRPLKARFARLVVGSRPWMDAPLSHQVTKVHTFSFFATPVILPIVAQTGHKQGRHASFPPEVSSPHFLVFSYSFGAKSHFKRSEKSTHLSAPCDHNCGRKAHKPAHPGLFEKKTSRPTDVDSCSLPLELTISRAL